MDMPFSLNVFPVTYDPVDKGAPIISNLAHRHTYLVFRAAGLALLSLYSSKWHGGTGGYTVHLEGCIVKLYCSYCSLQNREWHDSCLSGQTCATNALPAIDDPPATKSAASPKGPDYGANPKELSHIP